MGDSKLRIFLKILLSSKFKFTPFWVPPGGLSVNPPGFGPLYPHNPIQTRWHYGRPIFIMQE